MRGTLRTLTARLRNPLVAGALLVVVLVPGPTGAWLHQRLAAEPKELAETRGVKEAATTAAESVANALARWNVRLSAFAADQVARSGLAGARGMAEAELRERFPDAIHARVVAAAGQLEATEFAAQQLVRAILGGETFAVTALKDAGTGESAWELLLAVPIPVAGQAGGVALVSLPVTALAEAVNFDLRLGRWALEQRVPNAGAQPFLTLGRASARPAVRAPVANAADWQLSLRPAEAAPPPPPPLALVVAVHLIPWLLALGLLVFACQRAWAQTAALVIESAVPADAPVAATRRVAPVVERESALSPSSEPDSSRNQQPEQPAGEASDAGFPVTVFREYDIRGMVGEEISADFAEALGRTLGSLARDGAGDAARVAVARDGRISSPMLRAALVEGLVASGCEVVDLGLVPTPLLGFAAARLPDIHIAAMVTASHNPAGDNGFKIARDGQPLQGAELLDLHRQMQVRASGQASGSLVAHDIGAAYVKAMVEDIGAGLSRTLVVDCGNGAAGEIAPRVLEALGCTPIPLYCEIDGTFPNHPPDPVSTANLQDLRKAVMATGADLGIALDGDGDRLVAVSGSGRIVWPDELLLIFARDLLTAHPGATIVYDVKSTSRLGRLIDSYGGCAEMCRTGRAPIHRRIADLDAPLGGEFSGHIFFRDRWTGWDDALYAAARLLEILERREQSLDALLESFETTVATEEIRLPVAEQEKFALVERVRSHDSLADARIIDLDGLRAEFDGGWGLVRASNTEPAITLRFEAENQAQLEAIRARFRAVLVTVAPDLHLTF